MSVSITSRYRPLGIIEAPDAAGVLRPTVPIRRHPRTPAPPQRYRHRLTGVDGIEYLAWRYLGTSENWYAIADANASVYPLDWRAGDGVEIPSRDSVGRIETRERTF